MLRSYLQEKVSLKSIEKNDVKESTLLLSVTNSPD